MVRHGNIAIIVSKIVSPALPLMATIKKCAKLLLMGQPLHVIKLFTNYEKYFGKLLFECVEKFLIRESSFRDMSKNSFLLTSFQPVPQCCLSLKISRRLLSSDIYIVLSAQNKSQVIQKFRQ